MTDKPCLNCPDDDGMRVAHWQVWFDDGSIREGSTIDEWRDLPDDGVLALLLVYDQPGYGRTASGADYYFAAEGRLETIYGNSNLSAEDILTRYVGASVKRGRWTDDAFMRVVDKQIVREMGR